MAPGSTLMFDAMPAVHHLLLGHGRAVAALRATGAKEIGTATNHSPMWPASQDPADLAAAEIADTLWNRLFADPVLLGRYPDGFADADARTRSTTTSPRSAYPSTSTASTTTTRCWSRRRPRATRCRSSTATSRATR